MHSFTAFSIAFFEPLYVLTRSTNSLYSLRISHFFSIGCFFSVFILITLTLRSNSGSTLFLPSSLDLYNVFHTAHYTTTGYFSLQLHHDKTNRKIHCPYTLYSLSPIRFAPPIILFVHMGNA